MDKLENESSSDFIHIMIKARVVLEYPIEFRDFQSKIEFWLYFGHPN